MAPGEGDSLGTFQSLSARGRADASEDDSKAGRRDDGRAEKSDGEKQQLSCSVGLQRVYDGEQETSFFASQEVETVGQDDVCGFSEGSQNSFDVLSSNVEGDDSEDDDDDDEDEEPSSQSRFDHYNAVSSSAFNTPRNMFVRSSSACLTYRIPSGRQPSSFSSTARSDEPLNSLSPAPTDTSLLVGKDPDDEPLLTNQPVQLAGGSGGERVESVRISESHTEIFCNPAGPETPARAEKAGVAIRAGDLETDERCEPGTVSDRSKNSNPVAPSPYRNSPGGRTSSSDVSAVDQERSPALISSGPSILGLSLSPGVQTAVARAREAGRLEGTDASVGGGESQAGSRVFPQPECGGVLGRGPFAEREAQTLGSGAASLSSRSPLGELPSAKSVGGGLSVAAAGPASCPPFHTETTSRVSSTQSIDCGTVGLGKPENADGVTEDGALKSSDGESQKEKPDGEADNGLEQERREDVRAEERAKGKTEDLWMVNEGQSYCLVASGAHSEEEGDIQNTRERLALSADVRSEVRRLQRALDRLKTETTGELSRLQRKNEDLETLVYSLASSGCIPPIFPLPPPLPGPPRPFSVPSSASASLSLVSGRQTPSNEPEHAKQKDGRCAVFAAPERDRRASSEFWADGSDAKKEEPLAKTDVGGVTGKPDEEGFFEPPFEEERRNSKAGGSPVSLEGEQTSCAAVLLGRVAADGGFFSHLRFTGLESKKKKANNEEERATKESCSVGISGDLVSGVGSEHTKSVARNNLCHMGENIEIELRERRDDGSGVEEDRQADRRNSEDDAYAFLDDRCCTSAKGPESKPSTSEHEGNSGGGGGEGPCFFSHPKRPFSQGDRASCSCTMPEDRGKGTVESDVETLEDEEGAVDPEDGGNDRAVPEPAPSWFSDAWPFLRPLCYPVRALARLLGLNVNGAFDRWRDEVQSQSVRGTVVLGVLDATVCLGLVVGLVYISLFMSRVLFKTVYVHVHSIEDEKVQHYFEGLTYRFWGKKPMYFSDSQESTDGRWIAQRVNWYRSSQGYYY